MAFSTELRENRAFAAEIKFYVPQDRVESLREWARARLEPDPHGGGAFGDGYRTASLYFDTTEFDVFHRRGSYGRSKYRIRRYGQADRLFCERKLKTHDFVTKRRSVVNIEDLPRFGSLDPMKGWPGHWFHRRVLARALGVVCQISYERTALVHTNGQGPIRMTLDRHVRAAATSDLAFRPLDGEPSLSAENGILELKFHRSIPPVFEQMIEKFELSACPISKYRIAIRHLNLAPSALPQEAA